MIPDDGIEQGGLAAAVRPDNAGDRPLFHSHGNIYIGFHTTIRFGDIIYFNHIGHLLCLRLFSLIGLIDNNTEHFWIFGLQPAHKTLLEIDDIDDQNKTQRNPLQTSEGMSRLPL